MKFYLLDNNSNNQMKTENSKLQGDALPQSAQNGQSQQTSAHSRFKRFNYSKTLTLISLLMLNSMAAAQQQVQLSVASLTVEDNYVSKVSDAILEIGRRGGTTRPWQTDHCFELYVLSPYVDQDQYQSFKRDSPPVCEGLNDGAKVSCSVESPDRLRFFFTELSDVAKQDSLQKIKITNFYTPFSSQILGTINIRYYADSFCSTSQKTATAPSVIIGVQDMPDSNVEITSTSTVLGDTTSGNTLVIDFTPKTTMSPGGSGRVDLTIPYWYFVDQTGEYMYNPTATNKCASDCMNIYESFLSISDGSIQIKYDNMLPACISGAKIQIRCRQFFNPIEPRKWEGFQLTIYDSEVKLAAIERSSSKVALDASKYSPAIIPAQNLRVDPSNLMISSYSEWSMNLLISIPLNNECWFQIFLPPDFTFNQEQIIASGMFMKNQFDQFLDPSDLTVILKNGNDIPKTSLFFNGCKNSVGREPFGRIDISNISTPGQRKDSEPFEIRIWKDQQRSQLIAELGPGAFISGATFNPGKVLQMGMKPTNEFVQKTTSITVKFTTSHELKEKAAVLIRLPSGLSPKAKNTFVPVSSPDGSSTATSATILEGNVIRIIDLVAPGAPDQPPGTTFTLLVEDIQNQISARDAGDFEVTTQNFVIDQNGGGYYDVDQGISDSSYIAKPGSITPVGPIVISDPTNNANLNTYSLKFVIEDMVPSAGYFDVKFPEEIKLEPATTLSTASCKQFTCLQATESGLRFLITDGDLQPGTERTLEIGGVTNPRSFKPSGNIVVSTLDTDAVSEIDVGYSLPAEMKVAGPITSFSITQTNFTNGDVNTYTFAVQALIPVIVGDKFTMTLPEEIGAPVDAAAMQCQPRSNIKKMTCEVDGQKITIHLDEFTQPTGAFSWSISGIKNPGSTKPSSPFIDVQFVDKDGFVVSETLEPATITNQEPSNLMVYDILQGTKEADQPTEYTIFFTPHNGIPSTGSIQMTYPQQISLVDGAATKCTVTTSTGVFANNCVVNPNSQTITITEVFKDVVGYYQEEIQVKLENVRNPLNNKPGNGFVIQTYWDNKQIYIMDKLNDFILRPKFLCNYPCQTCDPNQRDICLSCWKGSDNPEYLMTFPNGTVTCRPTCELGYTSNGHPEKHCEKCDISCATCKDNGQAGDKNRCIDCAADHPFRQSQTDTCLKECAKGMYQSTPESCSLCKAPCAECEDNESNCKACFNPQVLYQAPKVAGEDEKPGQCLGNCPKTYLDVDGKCTKCASPCMECAGAIDKCISCDASISNSIYLYEEMCYSTCPRGTGPDNDKNTCFKCNPGCDLCDIKDIDKCLTCTRPTLVFDGKCVDECPSGFATAGMVPNEDGTACRPWQLSDMGWIPFPFLIAAAIFTIICLFGMMKRKAYLHKGKMATKSPQNTLTCIIIVLAPLQFIATIFQWILSLIYPLNTFAILAIVVTVLAIILNVVFQVWFSRSFNQKKFPADIERRVRLMKMSREEAKKHMVDKDEKFIAHKTAHRGLSYTIFALTASLSFKFNKAYYSFFYDLDPFKCHFTQSKYYRKMMTWFQISHLIFIDLLLICIDITGLTKVEKQPWNQLYITMIETLVLSILSIILGAIELYLLKDILAYTAEPKKKKRIRNDDSEEDSSEDLDKKFDKGKMAERREMMDKLLKQVKHNKLLFLNNKLDELLNQFGDRKCKSMMDLATGWELEPDPRMTNTWPVSPLRREEYDLDVQFTKDDAYGAQGNNVYADAKSKYMGMDFGTQDDAGFLEFQDALNRKHGGLMSNQMDGELEERRNKRQNRRRGRKNKYYAQIDHEDDQEADQVEQSDHEHDLQIIKEQEEEEEIMRRQVQAEAQRQQEIALARKKQLEEEKAAKLAQEQAEAEARRLRQLELERKQQEDAMAEQERLRLAAIQSKKLEEEALAEKKRREEEERRKIEEAARQSALARQEYEQAEALRQQKLKEEQERLAQEADQKRQRDLEDEAARKKAALEKAQQEQADRDAEELRQKQARQAEEDAQRQAEKEKARMDKDAALKAQLEREAAEREERDRLDREQAEREAQEREARRLREQQEREAERARRKKEEEDARNRAKLHAEAPDDDGFQTEIQQPTMAKKPSNPKPEPSSPRKDTYSEMNQSMHMADNLGDQLKEKVIDVPPNPDLRTFNVNDILGDVDHDEKGNVVAPQQDNNGKHKDKSGALTNQKGYLLDPNSNDVIENLNGETMFKNQDLDEKGELPGIFSIEKHNFNPHNLMGDFDYDNEQPQLMQTNKGFFMDKKARRVNKHGWMTLAGQGHLVDVHGRKKFDKSQLTKDGDLPKLFNYSGKRFDIKDVMGQFDKDAYGRIIHKSSQQGLVDNLGRRVNERGYLIDQQANIIDKSGKQLWRKEHLKNGEFPKIFPFTKFNIRRIQGDLDTERGQVILQKNSSGQLVDKKGRLVNQRGYLIDRQGNVIDQRGKLIFDRIILDKDGEIPAVFRTGLLQSETESDAMSRIDSNIDGRNRDNRDKDGETSLDSKMGDTPANYNDINQRFEPDLDRNSQQNPVPEEDDSEGGEHMAASSGNDDEGTDGQDPSVPKKKLKKKPKKKKPKLSTIEFLQPTGREKDMAGAYGGQAIGSIRRPGIKYEKERLEGSRKFRVSTADEPKVRAQLSNLVKSQSKLPPNERGSNSNDPGAVLQQKMNKTGYESQENKSQRSASRLRAGSRADSRSKVDRKKGPGAKNRKGGMKDGDFEQMFGKDIDQFLEDSEWDIESMDKVSHYSKGSGASHQNEMKLKQMEKLYLKRLEAQGASPNRGQRTGSQLGMQGSPGTRHKSKAGPDRETMINFSDDPGVIHRGEVLPFHTKKTNQTKK